MKSYLSRARSYINREKSITVSFLILSMVLMAGAVSAATTISTDITTGGSVTVSGTTTPSTFAGYVGIGTLSPDALLTVGVPSTGNNTGMTATFNLSTTSSGVAVQRGGVFNPQGLIFNVSQAGLYSSIDSFQEGVNWGPLILTSGNSYVGMGTTSPTVKLDIVDSNFNGTIWNTPFKIQNSTGIKEKFSLRFINTIVDLSSDYAGTPTNTNLTFSTRVSGGALSEKMRVDQNGFVGIGTVAPSSPLQVVASTTNATTSITIGQPGQNKGSCLVLYDAAGTVIYAYVAAGATTFTLSATSCK